MAVNEVKQLDLTAIIKLDDFQVSFLSSMTDFAIIDSRIRRLLHVDPDRLSLLRTDDPWNPPFLVRASLRNNPVE